MYFPLLSKENWPVTRSCNTGPFEGCNAGPFVGADFCCNKTEPRILYTPPTLLKNNNMCLSGGIRKPGSAASAPSSGAACTRHNHVWSSDSLATKQGFGWFPRHWKLIYWIEQKVNLSFLNRSYGKPKWTFWPDHYYPQIFVMFPFTFLESIHLTSTFITFPIDIPPFLIVCLDKIFRSKFLVPPSILGLKGSER